MSFLGWIITQILKLYYKTTCIFGKYVSTYLSKVFLFIATHAKFFLTAIIVFIASLLRIQHSKIGIFVACKDYINKNYFHQPCQITVHYPNVKTMHVEQKIIERKKK